MLRLRRATPIALALSLALAGGAFAGDNAGATFSLTSAETVSGVGPGETVTIEIAGSGFVGVKQLDLTIEVSDAANFNLAGAAMTTDPAAFAGFIGLPGQVDTDNPNRVRLGTALFDLTGTAPGANGDVSFTVTVPTSADFTADTQATISVALISMGPTSSDRDVFEAADLGLVTTLNPPVSDPTLSASTATDVSADFSAVGSGTTDDGSDGEVTLGVTFNDASGAAASGQAISWTVTNNGAESIFVLGAAATEVAAGASATVSTETDGSGGASITLDAEGDKSAGSTSASVSASTSADNSEGESIDLGVDFSVTWDVPVPAELASFAGEVTIGQDVRLQWGVLSQTNNLGWEVFRSTDNRVFARVSPLIPGEGTSDVFRTYEFLDEDPPAADMLYYYLRQLDLNGTATRSDVIQVAIATTAIAEQSLPLESALLQNYPNPFNPETTIRFDLASEAPVTLRVFDAAGQVVRTLVQASLPAGSYVQVWDGSNDAGVRVGSGVYIYELKAGNFSSIKKMTLLR